MTEESKPAKLTMLNWLWKNPRVLAYSGRDIPPLAPEPTIVLLYTVYSATGPALLKRHQLWMESRPQDKLYHMVEERAAYDHLLKAGLNCVYMTTNAWVDFQLYRPTDEPKVFDAILAGRMNPEKRHELAAGVGSLRVLGREEAPWDPPGYRKVVRERLPTASFGFVQTHEMRFEYSRCRVGLCLSSIEGACRAGSEMQLCGLPVVTTRALGARLETLNPVYSTVVADTPEAVADGVRTWVKKLPDPWEVRNSTLELLRKHRRVGIDLIQKIFDVNHVTVDFELLLHRQPSRLFNCRDLNRIEEFLDQDTQVR